MCVEFGLGEIPFPLHKTEQSFFTFCKKFAPVPPISPFRERSSSVNTKDGWMHDCTCQFNCWSWFCVPHSFKTHYYSGLVAIFDFATPTQRRACNLFAFCVAGNNHDLGSDRLMILIYLSADQVANILMTLWQLVTFIECINL